MMIFTWSQVNNTLIEPVAGGGQQTRGYVTESIANLGLELARRGGRGGTVNKQAAAERTDESIQRVEHSFDLLQLSVNNLSTQYYLTISRVCLTHIHNINRLLVEF